ncbi:MAG: NUDIX hydrolase [Candidatus Omnitrophota bacterium]|nr:NUDIX hydrolase [Candidatus Omnitrophota bacterium]
MKMYRKMVFNGRLLKVFRSRKALPEGKIGYFEEVQHPGAVLVVPFVGEKVVLLRQYRGVIGDYIWELPAGKLDPGETPYKCAKRELLEETGYLAKNIKKLGFIYTTPGFCDEKIYIFTADCSGKVEASKESDEIIEVSVLGKKSIRNLFREGRINDAKTIAGLSLAGIV